jgi:uncharacterized protein YggU (UPF0235/DUF167 family)
MSESAAPGQGFYTVRVRDIVLRVRAKPGARADRIAGVRGDNLLVEVRAAPERGRANEAVIRVLADTLGIKASVIALKTGHGAPRKMFILPLDARPALERLAGEPP